MLVVDVKIGCSRRRRHRVKWTLTSSVWYLSSSTAFERSGIGAEGNRGCGGGRGMVGRWQRICDRRSRRPQLVCC